MAGAAALVPRQWNPPPNVAENNNMTIRRIYNKALYYKVPVRGVVRLKSRRRRKLKRGDTDVPVLRASMSLLAQYRIPLCITTSPVITIGALNNLSLIHISEPTRPY